MTPTTTRPLAPTLADALAAFRRTMREAGANHDRGVNPRLPRYTSLRHTPEGRCALLALAAACGPRVTLRQPVPHLCYGPDCHGVGRVVAVLSPETAYLEVEWTCGRRDWLQGKALQLIAPGTAWEAENAAIGALLRARLEEARS